VFVLVVATNPRHRARQIVLVATLGGAVKQLIRAVERVETAPVARVGVVDDPVVESERAQPGLLRRGRLLGEVVAAVTGQFPEALGISGIDGPAGTPGTETAKS